MTDHSHNQEKSMNIHLKTTFITAAFVCLTYGHSFADNCSDYMSENCCNENSMACNGYQTYGGDPCSPKKGYGGNGINCLCQEKCGDVQCTLTEEPSWCSQE